VSRGDKLYLSSKQKASLSAASDQSLSVYLCCPNQLKFDPEQLHEKFKSKLAKIDSTHLPKKKYELAFKLGKECLEISEQVTTTNTISFLNGYRYMIMMVFGEQSAILCLLLFLRDSVT
jgi:hypothetical protein